MKRIIIIFYKLLHLIYKMLLFSYGANSIKKIKEECDYSQTLIEKEEYFYNDYQQFINIRLTKDKSSIADGDLFKKYYKQVFVKIDCGGQTKYFSKNKKDGFIDWTLLKSTPFGEKVSNFRYINLEKKNSTEKLIRSYVILCLYILGL